MFTIMNRKRGSKFLFFLFVCILLLTGCETSPAVSFKELTDRSNDRVTSKVESLLSEDDYIDRIISSLFFPGPEKELTIEIDRLGPLGPSSQTFHRVIYYRAPEYKVEDRYFIDHEGGIMNAIISLDQIFYIYGVPGYNENQENTEFWKSVADGEISLMEHTLHSVGASYAPAYSLLKGVVGTCEDGAYELLTFPFISDQANMMPNADEIIEQLQEDPSSISTSCHQVSYHGIPIKEVMELDVVRENLKDSDLKLGKTEAIVCMSAGRCLVVSILFSDGDQEYLMPLETFYGRMGSWEPFDKSYLPPPFEDGEIAYIQYELYHVRDEVAALEHAFQYACELSIADSPSPEFIP